MEEGEKHLGLHEKKNVWAIILGWNAPTARSIPQTDLSAKSHGSHFPEAGKKSHRYPVTRLTKAQKAALFAVLQGLLKMGKNLFTDYCALYNFTLLPVWTHIWLALYRGEAGNPCALSRCLPSSKFGLTAVAYIFQTNESRLKVHGSMPWSLLTQFPISALWGLPLCWWFPSLHLQPQLKQLSDFRLSPLLPFHQYFWRVQHHSSFCPVK